MGRRSAGARAARPASSVSPPPARAARAHLAAAPENEGVATLEAHHGGPLPGKVAQQLVDLLLAA